MQSSAEGLEQRLVEDENSVFRELLLKASRAQRRVGSRQNVPRLAVGQDVDQDVPAPESALFRKLIEMARVLPVEQFWFDDAYILEALGDEGAGVAAGFCDARVAEVVLRSFGDAFPRTGVLDGPGGLSGFLRRSHAAARTQGSATPVEQVLASASQSPES